MLPLNCKKNMTINHKPVKIVLWAHLEAGPRKIRLQIHSAVLLHGKCSGKGERFIRLEGKSEITCLKLSNEKVLHRCFLRIYVGGTFYLQP